MSVDYDTFLASKLLDSIKQGRALAIVDASTRQIVDIFKTQEVARIIRSVKKID